MSIEDKQTIAVYVMGIVTGATCVFLFLWGMSLG